VKKTITFVREKTTPGTTRYKEDGPPSQHVVGTLYVKKTSGLSADWLYVTISDEEPKA
jgi:hypothetical protein